MRVIVENRIPYIEGLIEPFAQVEYLPAHGITRQAVDRADALVVRTRTVCDQALLGGGRCKMVATATIGTDHIDADYCRSAGIEVASAPGCNAPAVAQYVHATVGRLVERDGLRPRDLTLGVVGVGHVGSIVARWASQLGYRTLLCDPPRARREGVAGFVDLSLIAAQADIITFHTPLTTWGRDATWHMCGDDFLASLARCRLLINSARGPVADTAALVAAIDRGQVGSAAIDCWENEPDISRELLARAWVATPHIAGYSAEGKARATAMAVEALGRHFGWSVAPEWPTAPMLGAAAVDLERIIASYDPLADTEVLRSDPEAFERLRNHYRLRREVT